ncbi:hypothetical protein [Arthrobacter sp. lap29]|uniref:hypothetical protein n=1 Tax=Arthrobacter sp. lap29 TaxID=3056122 RepID=UPI0028F719D2|nr:hypothetical protein [Arthrobacter sp. lap29]
MAEEYKERTVFSVEGGPGSVSYTLAEIAGAGVELGQLARDMLSLVERIQAEWFWLNGAAAGAAPYPHGPLDALLNALWAGRRVQEDTAALARKTAQAGASYAAAEARNAAITARLESLAALRQGLHAGSLGPLALFGVAQNIATSLRKPGTGLRDVVEKILNDAGPYGAGLLGPGFGMAYLLSQLRGQGTSTPGVKQAFVLRKLFDTAGLAHPGHMVVRQLPAQEWDSAEPSFPSGHASSTEGRPWTVEASIEGLLDGSNDAYKYPPGSIGVVRVQRPDGTPVWLVHLPGTEDWSTVDSANPFDMEGNLEGLTAAQAEAFKQQEVLMQQLIKESLRAAGALPGEEVLLTGHSGGGIHAAAAAADSAFLAEVNVKMIVIAGAPARNAEVPASTAVLDLQNEHDLVTAADFGPPAPTPNWVTVTSHRPPLPEGTDLGDILKEAHSLDNYLDDAAALDNPENSATDGSREAIKTILGAGVAGAAVAGTKWVFQGKDVDDQPRSGTKSEKGAGTKNKSEKSDRYKLGVR